MLSRRQKRQQAYSYILNQAKKINWNFERSFESSINDVGYISLTDIQELKEGLSNPSPELVATLKILFRRVASQDEIDNHLIKPFLDEQ